MRISELKAVSKARAASDTPEINLVKSIQLKPEFINILNSCSGGRKKQQQMLEEYAKEWECSVEILKEALLSARRKGETKKAKESSETRPRSARSSSIEPKETRRSLRSQSIDKISVTSTTVLESTDNSCASSVCGSPRSEDKQQQQQPATRRNLCAINEDDINLEATANASSADSSQQRRKARIDDNAEPNQESVNGTDNQSQPTSNDAHEAEVQGAPFTASSAMTRYLESTSANDNKSMRCLRFSEPVQTPRSSQTVLSGLNSASRRLSSSANKGTKMKMPNPEDPTRMFFESIGLTVMSFPQHLQASVKAQVSNIVHELEYELCSPLTEKTVATVSVGS